MNTQGVLFPKENVAIFWNYEDFFLPKDIPEKIFFPTLFPSSNEIFLVKRVYGSPNRIIESLQHVFLQNGFEYIQGIGTGKSNSSDFIMSTDCIEYCTQQTPPLIVIIISGDADFLPLIQKLVQQGHEVRLIVRIR